MATGSVPISLTKLAEEASHQDDVPIMSIKEMDGYIKALGDKRNETQKKINEIDEKLQFERNTLLKYLGAIELSGQIRKQMVDKRAVLEKQAEEEKKRLSPVMEESDPNENAEQQSAEQLPDAPVQPDADPEPAQTANLSRFPSTGFQYSQV